MTNTLTYLPQCQWRSYTKLSPVITENEGDGEEHDADANGDAGDDVDEVIDLFRQLGLVNLQTWSTVPLNFSPSSLLTKPNQLEGLSLETLSSQVLEFEGKALALANTTGAPFDASFLGMLLVQIICLIMPRHQWRRKKVS